jgi:hypothetical protein
MQRRHHRANKRSWRPGRLSESLLAEPTIDQSGSHLFLSTEVMANSRRNGLPDCDHALGRDTSNDVSVAMSFLLMAK